MSEPVRDRQWTEGWLDAEVERELPGLRLVETPAPHVRGRASRELRGRLGALSDRFRGPDALAQRTWPVPGAFRELYRQLGLDPDAEPTPIEAAGRERLRRGAFKARGHVRSALLLALVETGVPVWALDDARLDGPLGIRRAQPGERLGEGEHANDIAPGRLVVADASAPAALLFGGIAPGREPRRGTERLRLFAITAPGVPEAHVSESLWLATTALGHHA